MDSTELSVDSLDTQALDALPVAVCVTDRDGRILYADTILANGNVTSSVRKKSAGVLTVDANTCM